MSFRFRSNLILLGIFFIAGIIVFRLFTLQILRYEFYRALAQDQYHFYKTLFPQRGEIFFQDYNQGEIYPLAINQEVRQVYAEPKFIPKEKREEIAQKLSSLLDLDFELILKRISKENDPYEPLAHKVSLDLAKQIEQLGLPGIKTAPEQRRFYPFDSLASHIVGFVGIKDNQPKGMYGLEGYYDEELKGKEGYLTGEKDTAGYWIPLANYHFQPAEDGPRLILTIDQNIQFFIEKELKKIIEKWSAKGGTVIVMDPQTGALLGLANLPNFNPNEYSQVEDISVFKNPAIQVIYEPGSVFKPITLAIGLAEKKITPETVYQDKGKIKIGGYIISNVDGRAYGQQTMVQVLEKSLNTGAVFVQQQIEKEIFLEYLKRFGFGQLTGIDLAGEVKGNIANLENGREINFATASFGQGVAVTPLQLIRALAVIANQGRLVRPYVVAKKIYSDGHEIATKPQIIRQVIPSETAQELTEMLVSVVENGYGRKARINGYTIAGKTGTAQVPDLEKGGYSDKTIHTFVGFAPAFQPKFIILVKLDEPQGIRFAADSVAPAFKEIAEYLFNYFQIPPG